MPSPTPRSSRFASLDILRGVALLGILLMNVQSFSMPEEAYTNPSAFGDLSGANFYVWFATHLFIDQKMMTLFSLLFGAGVSLQLTRLEAETGKTELSPPAVHFRRMTVLLFLGLAHAYLMWFGDILVAYALCGMALYFFRKWNPARLALAGLLVFAGQNVVSYICHGSISSPVLWQLRHFIFSLDITHFTTTDELHFYRNSYYAELQHRVPEAFMFQTSVFLTYTFWRVMGLMLFGAALLRAGFFTLQLPRRTYAAVLVLTAAAGAVMTWNAAANNVERQWSNEAYFGNALLDYWGSFLLGLAWAALVLLLCASRFRHLLRPFARVGQMALTNYLMQTAICTTIFYGHGLGRFGTFERTAQLQLVLWIWALQLALSNVWLGFAQFGPVEWLWRSLTYGHAQAWGKPPLSPPAEFSRASLPPPPPAEAQE